MTRTTSSIAPLPVRKRCLLLFSFFIFLQMDREKERAGVRPACKIEARLRGTGVTRSCRFESEAEFDRINRSMLIVSRNMIKNISSSRFVYLVSIRSSNRLIFSFVWRGRKLDRSKKVKIRLFEYKDIMAWRNVGARSCSESDTDIGRLNKFRKISLRFLALKLS